MKGTRTIFRRFGLGVPAVVVCWMLSGAAPAQDADATLRLPDPVEDVAVGDGGRLLVLKLVGEDGLRVYDVGTGKLSGRIRLPTSEFAFAAGGRSVLVYLKGEDRFQLWSLDDAKLVEEAPCRATLPVMAVVMGHARDDRALVVYGVATGGSGGFNNGPVELGLLDLPDLEAGPRLEFPQGTMGFDSYRLSTIRTDGNLDRIAFWSTQVSPSGVSVLELTGSPRPLYDHNSMGFLATGDDGLIYAGSGQILAVRPADAGPQGSPPYELRGQFADQMLVPAVGGAFFVGAKANGNLQLYQSGRSAALCDLGKFPGLWQNDQSGKLVEGPPPAGTVVDAGNLLVHRFAEMSQGPLSFDRRVIVVPEADAIVFLPLANDRLVRRPLDLKGRLDRKGREYLLVLSAPPTRMAAGSDLKHRVEALSHTGKATFALEEGPEGMAISPEGELTWHAPGGLTGRAPVRLRLTDGGEKEALHSFDLMIE